MSLGPLARLLALSALALGLSLPSALAAPIGVRAKTRVELAHRRAATGLVLVGRLLDDGGAAVAHERVTLELPDLAPMPRVTDVEGRFEVALTASEVAHIRREGDLVTWTVRFDGNSRLGDTAESGSLDLAKRATKMQVAISAPVSVSGEDEAIVLGDRPVELTVTLSDTSEGAARPMAMAEVALEVGTGSQLVGATGRSGSATFVVRPTSFAGGGRYRVKARFAGDAIHGPSRAETEFVVLLPTRVTLRVVREGDEEHGRYRMSGRVSDEATPLDGQLVAIVATLQREAATPGDAAATERAFELVAATNADGLFVTALSAAELQALRGKLNLPRERVRLAVRAQVASSDGFHAPSESTAVALEIPSPPGVPLRWYLLALALAVGFIAVARALRSGALMNALRALTQALRAWLDRWRKKAPALVILPNDEPLLVTRFDLPEQRLERTYDQLAGVVVDAHTRMPVVGTVTARAGESLVQAHCNALGAFRVGPLAPGAWSVTVEAPGHLPREVALEVPHDGTYDGAQWALVAVQRSVREIFAGALRGLGTPLAWGYATPREATREALEAQATRPTLEPPLEELRGLVERTHYAPRFGTAADVERARHLRDALEEHRGGGA